MKNSTSMYTRSPEYFFKLLWESKPTYRRKAQGECTEYAYGELERHDTQEDTLERRNGLEHVTVTLHSDEGEEIYIDYLVTCTRRKEEDSRFYQDYAVTLSTGGDGGHRLSDIMYMRLYEDEMPEASQDDAVQEHKDMFNDFISQAHHIHYKNTLHRLRKCQELFRDTTTELMKSYLTK